MYYGRITVAADHAKEVAQKIMDTCSGATVMVVPTNPTVHLILVRGAVPYLDFPDTWEDATVNKCTTYAESFCLMPDGDIRINTGTEIVTNKKKPIDDAYIQPWMDKRKGNTMDARFNRDWDYHLGNNGVLIRRKKQLYKARFYASVKLAYDKVNDFVDLMRAFPHITYKIGLPNLTYGGGMFSVPIVMKGTIDNMWVPPTHDTYSGRPRLPFKSVNIAVRNRHTKKGYVIQYGGGIYFGVDNSNVRDEKDNPDFTTSWLASAKRISNLFKQLEGI